MSGIFSVNSASRLFEKLSRSIQAFEENPTEEGIFEIIFPLYHLREWILPNGFASYKDKSETELTKEEKVHFHLHTNVPEYTVVRELCNNAKHYKDMGLTGRTSVLEGFRVGYGRVGDRLDVTHFVVDGKDIRDFFNPVFQVYYDYFHTSDSSLDKLVR